MRLLLLQHFCNREALVFGVADLRPQSPTALREPRIERIKRGKALRLGGKPDSSTCVLYVLLDNALLPSTGDVAEVRVEKVVRTEVAKRALTVRSFQRPTLSTAVFMLS